MIVTIGDNRASRFTSPVYDHSLVENIGVNEPVTTMIANDSNSDEITYSIMICFILYLLLLLNTAVLR